MKQRLISAALGILLAILVLFFYKTLVFNIVVAIINILAVYEIFAATKNVVHTELMIVCFTFAAMSPFFNYFSMSKVSLAICFLFLFLLMILLLSRHKTLRFEQVGLMFMLTLFISVSFSCIVYLRDWYLASSRFLDEALFYICVIFLGAWITDAGGYFIGSWFGKHRLSPQISPKKTVEGAVGGVFMTVIVLIAAAFIYMAYLSFHGEKMHIYFVPLIGLSLLCAVLSIVGDLSASLLKRENGIKDFGNILPGHGGILDRFDSVLFVAPLVLIFLQIRPIIG